MFTSSSALASGDSGTSATTDALHEALKNIGDTPLIGALIFASSKFDQTEVVEAAAAVLGDSIPFSGASTAGEIATSGPSMAPSVSVILFASDTISCQTTVVQDVPGDEDNKGAELARALQSHSSLVPAFVTINADGLTINPNGILRGIESIFPDTPVAGGSAGDDGNYKQTYQYCNGKVYSNSVTALSFYGPLKLAIGVRHGWTPISGTRTVTRASGAVVHEIDNKPAISLYQEFIGEESDKLKEVTLAEIALSYPVGLIVEHSKEMLLRAPFTVDANGSITFGGEIPEGSRVQLMMGTKEQAVDAARIASAEAVAELGTTPKAALIYSCHVRDSLYESRDEAKREIDAIQDAIGKNVPLAGFYTYAEQAPIGTENVDVQTCNTSTHNETIVTVLFAESHE